MRLIYFFIACFIILPGMSNAQANFPALEKLVNDPRLAGASVGVAVIDIESGQLLADYAGHKMHIPASTQKLITTAAALDLLGPDATFQTSIAIDGEILAGVLNGNLFILGGGDPSLGSPSLSGASPRATLLQAWTAAIQAAGIREINGYVIADDSYYGTDGIAMGWPWADLGNYYGAGAYGLNWHENFYYLDFTQRQNIGAIPPIQQTRPLVPGLKLFNEVRTAASGSGDNGYIYGAPFNFDNYLRGTIPAGTGRFTIKGSIPDPPLLAAQELRARLIKADIKVPLPASTSRLLGIKYAGLGQVIHTHQSPPLSKIVDRTNLRSVNLYAETLLRELNKARGEEVHKLANTQVLYDYLSNELGLDTKGVNLEDGSGLATRNFFSPLLMASMLSKLADNEHFLNSIPLAGRTGSLRNRLKGTAAEGRLYAKSGSLNAVRCYAGYAFPADGRRLAFSVMVNNHTLSGSALNKLLFDFMAGLCR